jgi:SAM-dependent methyltransferase
MRRVDSLLRATARAEAQHFWFRGFRLFVAPLLRQAVTGVTRPRIVDCGCGTGANLDFLAQFGSPIGFDLTAVGLVIGRRAGRRRLVRASVTAVPFADRSFDVATSFDVLYALDAVAERAAVAEMYRLIRPGGFVIVNVAAMNVLRGDHSVLGREVRRYSRSSLTRLLTGSGFVIQRITYTNASLFLPMVAARTLQRARGLTDEAHAHHELEVPSPLVNAALTTVLRLEAAWLRAFNNPFGSSLLCLAKKPG